MTKRIRRGLACVAVLLACGSMGRVFGADGLGAVAPAASPVPSPGPATVLTPTAPAGPARLVCDKPEFNFGESDNARDIDHVFVVRNVSKEPVLIKRVTASCGCTVATVSTNTVPPGQEATVKAVLNLRGRVGPQNKDIQVESDDPGNPVLHLTIVGSSTAELTVDPMYLNFGDLAEDSVVVKPVTVTSRRPGVSVTNVIIESKAFAVSLWKKGDPRGVGFDVTTVPPLMSDHMYTKVTVQTDHPTVREATLQVFGLVKGELMIVPKEILIRQNTAAPINRAVLIRPGTAKDFKLISAEVAAAGVETSVTSQGLGNYRIDVRNLTSSPEMEGKSLKITTDLKKSREILVPIRIVP